jgi:hypothetical protein
MQRIGGIGRMATCRMATWMGAALLAATLGGEALAHSSLSVEAPRKGQLSLEGPVALSLRLPGGADVGTLAVLLDGAPVDPASLTVTGVRVRGTLAGLLAGRHTLDVSVATPRGTQTRSSWFELVVLDRPDECEVLNQAACLLPFPSSRFLERAKTETGYRVVYPPNSLPSFRRLETPLTIPPNVLAEGPIDPTPFLQNDGFSPTAQILMSFPGGFDPVLSDAPRLDPTTRTFGGRGNDRSSPTLLIDWETGKRVNHWVENDVRSRNLQRRVTFLRPAESLLPGHRYIVAVRRLVKSDGTPVLPEPVFEAIRDERPSDIPAVRKAARRLEPVFERLDDFDVDRDELMLAFDFVVSSDESLTREMLSMRDQAFEWLDEQQDAGVTTFQVDQVIARNESCDPSGSPVWRELRGTFQVPLFLGSDPFTAPTVPSTLQRDADGEPVWTALTNAPFGLAIPCAAAGAPVPTLLIGHGLFGNGPSVVDDLASLPGFAFVAAGTNWSGLSSPDVGPDLFGSFIVQVIADADKFEALPDRLRQGQLDTLVLARMLKRGHFNAAPDAQLGGHGPIDASAPTYYFGASLGGIMGTMFAALTPDVERLNLDVPAINFSFLLQRATPFIQFQTLLNLVNNDPTDQALALGLNQELWVRGEPSGYATHITGRPRSPLPGVNRKKVLVTAALYDQQVSNLGSHLLARTLRLPVLEGSVLRDLPSLPDSVGAQPSAYVVYDTGSFDPANPLHTPFIPPLVNRPATPNACDPHGRRGLIPASITQLQGFFTPDGVIENFCADGVCDASEPNEIPFGADAPCNPVP